MGPPPGLFFQERKDLHDYRFCSDVSVQELSRRTGLGSAQVPERQHTNVHSESELRNVQDYNQTRLDPRSNAASLINEREDLHEKVSFAELLCAVFGCDCQRGNLSGRRESCGPFRQTGCESSQASCPSVGEIRQVVIQKGYVPTPASGQIGQKERIGS